MQRAGGLVAMAPCRIRQAQRQFSIAAQALLEDMNVPWAIHRLMAKVRSSGVVVM